MATTAAHDQNQDLGTVKVTPVEDDVDFFPKSENQRPRYLVATSNSTKCGIFGYMNLLGGNQSSRQKKHEILDKVSHDIRTQILPAYCIRMSEIPECKEQQDIPINNNKCEH